MKRFYFLNQTVKCPETQFCVVDSTNQTVINNLTQSTKQPNAYFSIYLHQKCHFNVGIVVEDDMLKHMPLFFQNVI